MELKFTSNKNFSLNNSLCGTVCNCIRPNSTTNKTVMSVLCPICLLLRGSSALIKTNQSAVQIASPSRIIIFCGNCLIQTRMLLKVLKVTRAHVLRTGVYFSMILLLWKKCIHSGLLSQCKVRLELTFLIYKEIYGWCVFVFGSCLAEDFKWFSSFSLCPSVSSSLKWGW